MLAAAYFPYAWGVGVLVRNQQVEQQQPEDEPSTPEPKAPRQLVEAERIALQHLSSQPWAQNANIQFRDGNEFFFYAEKFEQTDTKEAIRFEPIALVMFSKDGPLTIVAESALVQFQGELRLNNPKPGRVINARLEGAVEIRGERNLAINGRQFFYSEKAARIWSDNPAQFSYEDHRGESDQGIQIDLSISEVDLPGRQLNIEGVQRVQLFQHVFMELALPGEQGREPKPLSVQCEGSFRFEWKDKGQSALAIFEDKVKVRQPTSPTEMDGIDCDRLDVSFGQVAVAPEGVAQNNKDSLALRTQLQPKSFVARGAPIVATSDRSQLRATLGYLRYDVEQRALAMAGSENNATLTRRGSTAKSKPIRITQANSEIESQQIALKHDADRNLKEVVCRGEGWLTYLDPKTQEPAMIVEWVDQLRKYPDSASPLDIVDLTGNASVKQPQQRTGLSANYIKLWMDPLQPAIPQAGKKATLDPQPHRMLALDNVTLVSPELKGTTTQLQVWFDDVKLKREPSSPTGPLKQASLRTPQRTDVASTGRKPKDPGMRIQPAGGELQEPETLPADEEDPIPAPKAKIKEPLVVNSKLIRVLVAGRGPNSKPEVSEVWTEGNVHVSQNRLPGQAPLELFADQLHIKNEGDNDQVIHLLGQPARIDDPSFGLVGREVFLNRGRNVMWVDGEGELSRLIDRDFEGRPLASPTQFTVHWDEQMVFDGLIAKFNGRVHAAMQDSSMKCRQMEVQMKRRVSFQDSEQALEKDLVERVVCRYSVEVISTEGGKDGAPAHEYRRGRFVEFAMDMTKGIAAAKGPGTLQIWQRGRGKLTGLAPSGVSGANQAMRPRDVGWDYTQIEFNDVMNLKSQRESHARSAVAAQQNKSGMDRYASTATCTGQVRVTYGPVDEPLTSFNTDRLPKDAVLLSCDDFQAAQQPPKAPGGKPTVEFIAEKNARVEGHGFNGQGDFISFDGANDLFTIRSLGDADSMLQREARPGAGGVPVVAKTIRFSRTRNKIDIGDASFAEGIQ